MFMDMLIKTRRTTNEEKQLKMSKTDKGSLVVGAVMKVSKKADTSGGWQACNLTWLNLQPE